MDSRAFLETMGDLVQDVAQRMINEILSQEDVGEQESQNLSALCKMLHDLQDIFAEGERVSEHLDHRAFRLCLPVDTTQSLVGAFVPSWYKLLFLSEILEGSMVRLHSMLSSGSHSLTTLPYTQVDIMYLFDEGILVDFSREEVIRLIRALFSESAARQQNIDKIRSAPESTRE